MSYMDVMYGNLGQVNNQLQGNLAQNAAMNQNQQASMAAQQQAAAAQQAQLAALYGPQGFGGQTDYYSGLGAAYGRGTGYYGDTSGLSPGNAPQPGLPPGVSGPGFNPLDAAAGGGYQDPWAGTKWANGTTPYNDYGLGNTFSATGNVGQSPGMAPGYGGFNNPAVPTSPQQWYANGGYDPYNPATYGGAAQQNVGQGFPGMGTPTGASSGGYDPQMGGSSSFPKGMQAQDWNNYFSTAAAPAAGGKGGGWEAEYLLANPDVMAAAAQAGGNVNAFADQHYRDYGQKEGRGVFDANAYLQENPDVFAAGANPFQHYNQYGKNEGRAAPMSGTFDPETYLALNPDVAAAGVDPTAHWMQYGQNEGRAGAFAPSNYALGQGANYDFSNPLVSQRSDYASRIRDDPNLSLKLAARLYSEDQNNPATRQAILEAMLNRQAATGQDPLNAAYYPQNQSAYNSALSKLSGNNDLLNQIYQEMEQPFGGSNTSNYATDWASADVANNERQYATPTWTSPTNEQFFRKDISNDWTGLPIAAKNQAWYQSLTGPPQ